MELDPQAVAAALLAIRHRRPTRLRVGPTVLFWLHGDAIRSSTFNDYRLCMPVTVVRVSDRECEVMPIINAFMELTDGPITQTQTVAQVQGNQTQSQPSQGPAMG